MSDPDRPAGRNVLREGASEQDLELAIVGFAALWRGDRLRPTTLLPDRGGVGEAATALAGRGRAELDDDGRLVGIHGLTLRASRHSFRVAGRTHRTWCAFDAIGIPAALILDANAHTDCPTCHRRLDVRIERGEPKANGAVLWLPTEAVTNLLTEFCAAADLYCCAAHVDEAIDTCQVEGTITNLGDAAALGRETWADIAHLRPALTGS